MPGHTVTGSGGQDLDVFGGRGEGHYVTHHVENVPSEARGGERLLNA